MAGDAFDDGMHRLPPHMVSQSMGQQPLTQSMTQPMTQPLTQPLAYGGTGFALPGTTMPMTSMGMGMGGMGMGMGMEALPNYYDTSSSTMLPTSLATARLPLLPAAAAAASASASAPAPMSASSSSPTTATSTTASKKKPRRKDTTAQKRRCVSTACISCRKRKSRCDNALPSCAACAKVYNTECVYDPNSDHRRKGVYREKVVDSNVKAQAATLQVLIRAILSADEDVVPDLVKQIRTCDSLDAVADAISKGQPPAPPATEPEDYGIVENSVDDQDDTGENEDGGEHDGDHGNDNNNNKKPNEPAFEGELELARKMGALRLENGSVRFYGGTSNLLYTGDPSDKAAEEETGNADPDEGEEDPEGKMAPPASALASALAASDATPVRAAAAATAAAQLQFEAPHRTLDDALRSWTTVTDDTGLILHLLNMYFDWHYTYFATLSKSLFYRDFLRGKPRTTPRRRTVYCTSLLVNAMLALGCHYTSTAGAFAVAGDERTKGDHFFAEARRLIVTNDEFETPRLATVQALALLSVREAGCAREAKGWVYSGMAFRMAQDIGLNYDDGGGGSNGSAGGVACAGEGRLRAEEVDARRMTFWGCFLFDKAWSNYMGRLPQLPKNSYSLARYEVVAEEDAAPWSPYTDAGYDLSLRQAARTRAVGLQLSQLCEISSDILLVFYHPVHIGKQQSTGKAVELKKLGELQRRLEDWRRALPADMEPREGQLPNVLLMHMFFHLQYIHLFRPFLKYKTPETSPLPAHVSPRRICTNNAGAISKLMRLYKKTYNLRQICNIAVYMIHAACTIHLLNLPDKTAKRNMIHGVRQLEEMAADWPCARRTLGILSILSRKWGVVLPDEAAQVLQRSDARMGGGFASSCGKGGAGSTAAFPQQPVKREPPYTTGGGMDGGGGGMSMGSSSAMAMAMASAGGSPFDGGASGASRSGSSSIGGDDTLFMEVTSASAPTTTTSTASDNFLSADLAMGGYVAGAPGPALEPRFLPPPPPLLKTQASASSVGSGSGSAGGGFPGAQMFFMDDPTTDFFLRDGSGWQHNLGGWEQPSGQGQHQQGQHQQGQHQQGQGQGQQEMGNSHDVFMFPM